MQTLRFAREHDAVDERVKDTFTDIKASLRAPLVSSLFEAWGVYPRFLESTWRRLRPNVLSRSFQDHARRLGEIAARGIALWPVGNHVAALHARNVGDADLRRMRDIVEFFFSIDPKLLIAARAVQLALAGEEVGGATISGPQTIDKSSLPDYRGLAIAMVEEQGAPLRVRRIYGEMKNGLGVEFLSKDYLAIGANPDWLEVWWKDTKGVMQHARYQSLCDDLSAQALESARAIPYRIRLTSDQLGRWEMNDDDRRRIAQINQSFCDSLPALCVNLAIARHGLGAA